MTRPIRYRTKNSTPDSIGALAAALRNYPTVQAACAAIGLPVSTAKSWRQRYALIANAWPATHGGRRRKAVAMQALKP